MTYAERVAEYSGALESYVRDLRLLENLLAHISESTRRYKSGEFDSTCSKALEAAMVMVKQERAIRDEDVRFDSIREKGSKIASRFFENGDPQFAANIRKVGGTPRAKTYGNVKMLVAGDTVEAVNISEMSRNTGFAEAKVEGEQRAGKSLIDIEGLASVKKDFRLHAFLDDDGSDYSICPKCDSVFSSTCHICGKTREELLGSA